MVDSCVKPLFLGKQKHRNRKMMGGGTLDVKKFIDLVNEKKTFLLAVFANLLLQLGITYFTMMSFPVSVSADSTKSSASKGGIANYFWLLIIVQFIIIFVLALVSMPSWLKFLLFSLFSFTCGLLFSVYRTNPAFFGLIQFAVAGTAGIFGAMMLIGLLLILFGIQLTAAFGSVLFFVLLLFIIFILVVTLTNAVATYVRWIGAIGLFIFSLYIIYDTNRILQRNYMGDFITASMDYYLDAINIFADLMDLFSGGR